MMCALFAELCGDDICFDLDCYTERQQKELREKNILTDTGLSRKDLAAGESASIAPDTPPQPESTQEAPQTTFSHARSLFIVKLTDMVSKDIATVNSVPLMLSASGTSSLSVRAGVPHPS
jgi:hypothetical protein